MRALARRGGRPRPVGDVLASLLRDLGLDKAVRQQQALEVWATVVGEHVGRVTVPKAIKNGRLFVEVSNSAWRAEIFQRREDIRARLNAALGSPDVREIVLV